MPAPAKCPACGCQLQPDWDNCPACPMSFRETVAPKSATESDAFRGVVLPIVFFAGLAFVIWSMGQFLWNTADESSKVSAEAFKKPGAAGEGKTPEQLLKDAEQAEIARRAGGGGGAPAPEGAKLPSEPADAEEEGGTISIMPTQQAAKPVKPVTEWKLRGVTYDLLTLKPLPGVQVIFTDNQTNSRAQVQTDAQGRYRTILPPLNGHGYTVTVSKPGYAKSYLNPGTEGVAEMPLSQRQELAKELKASIAEPASVEPNSEAPLVTDFHLVPQ